MKKLTFLFALLISLTYSAHAQSDAEIAKDPEAYMSAQRSIADDLKVNTLKKVEGLKKKADLAADAAIELAVSKVAGKGKMAEKMARKVATKTANKVKAKAYGKADKLVGETEKKYDSIIQTAEDKVKSLTSK